jgi:hypothetical protein
MSFFEAVVEIHLSLKLNKHPKANLACLNPQNTLYYLCTTDEKNVLSKLCKPEKKPLNNYLCVKPISG